MMQKVPKRSPWPCGSLVMPWGRWFGTCGHCTLCQSFTESSPRHMTPPSIVDLWSNLSARHGLLAPLPIAAAILSALPALFMALLAYRKRSLAACTILLLLLGSILAALASITRIAFVERIQASTPSLMQVEQATLDRYVGLIGPAWIWFLIPIPFLAISMLRHMGIRIGAGVLGTLAVCCLAGWGIVTLQAWTGMIFLQGIGVPPRIPDSSLTIPAPTDSVADSAASLDDSPSGQSPLPESIMDGSDPEE